MSLQQDVANLIDLRGSYSYLLLNNLSALFRLRPPNYVSLLET